MDLAEYVEVFQLIVSAGAVSLPIVVSCSLAERVYWAMLSMITGQRVVKF